MHPQLEILLQIQDLRSQRAQLALSEGAERDLQRAEFSIDAEQAVATLDEKIGEMEADLEPAVRARYLRIASGRDRVVAPVINGTCYACFVSVPTAHGVSSGQNRSLSSCQNCGRFLYVVG